MDFHIKWDEVLRIFFFLLVTVLAIIPERQSLIDPTSNGIPGQPQFCVDHFPA